MMTLEKENKLQFLVDRNATKNQIKKEIEKTFEQEVTGISTVMNMHGEKKAIISRMLFNLKGIYYQREDYYRALCVVERILLLNPGIPSEIRDRGLLYMHTSLFAEALADLEHYLSAAAAPDSHSTCRRTPRSPTPSSARNLSSGCGWTRAASPPRSSGSAARRERPCARAIAWNC